MPTTLTAPISDSPAGKSLNSITSVFDAALADGLKNGVGTTKVADAPPTDVDIPADQVAKVETDKAKPDDATVSTAKPDPKTEKSDPKAKTPPVADKKDAPKPDAKTPVAEEKKKLKVGELTDDEKPLLSSQQRVIDAFRGKDERIKELSGELEPLKAKLAELEAQVGGAPKELESLRAEVERLKAENSEYDGKVSAYSVTQSREYKSSVQDPWDNEIIGKRDDKGMPQGGLNQLAAQLHAAGHKDFDAVAALNAIQTGDEAVIERILNSLPTDRARQRLSGLYDKGQALLAKHREYTAKSGDALKAIQERQTQAERQAAEQTRAEVGRIGAGLSKQVATRFTFLNGIEGDEQLNTALKKAQEAMDKFDVVNATPQERAEAAHARAFAPIIATHLEMVIQRQQNEAAQEKADREKVEGELREQIAGLEERLGNLNGETQVAQPGARDGQGRFAPKVDSNTLFKKLMAGKG